MIVTIFGTLSHVFLSAVAGYALAQPQFPGKRLMTGIILITMMIPFQAIMIPVYVTMQQLGLLNSLFALILSGMVSGYSIFLMRNFFLAIPKDLLEAAVIDGAGHFRLFFQICLLLSKAGLATVALFEFVGRWNDILSTILFINDPSKYTLQVALNMLINEGDATSSGMLVTNNVKMAGTPFSFSQSQKRPIGTSPIGQIPLFMWPQVHTLTMNHYTILVNSEMFTISSSVNSPNESTKTFVYLI